MTISSRWLCKIKFPLIATFILSSILVGCGYSSKSENPSVSLSKVTISRTKDSKLIKILNSNQLEDGIYYIETYEGKYVLFYGVENSYNDISCILNKNILEIHTNTKNAPPKIEKLLYELKYSDSNLFDTIAVIRNGEDGYFNSIIGN